MITHHGYKRVAVDDPTTTDAPEPLVQSVSHGWSMMGYYYVNVTTGAERGPFPQTIICKDKAQAAFIAAALNKACQGRDAMKHGNLDKVHRYDFDFVDEHGDDARGDFYPADQVRAAYALDLEAAVAKARADERRKCFEEMRLEIKIARSADHMSACRCGDCVLDYFGDWATAKRDDEDIP
jgi:hypothetical protein